VLHLLFGFPSTTLVLVFCLAISLLCKLLNFAHRQRAPLCSVASQNFPHSSIPLPPHLSPTLIWFLSGETTQAWWCFYCWQAEKPRFASIGGGAFKIQIFLSNSESSRFYSFICSEIVIVIADLSAPVHTSVVRLSYACRVNEAKVRVIWVERIWSGNGSIRFTHGSCLVVIHYLLFCMLTFKFCFVASWEGVWGIDQQASRCGFWSATRVEWMKVRLLCTNQTQYPLSTIVSSVPRLLLS
jgi:hypothetical protein